MEWNPWKKIKDLAAKISELIGQLRVAESAVTVAEEISNQLQKSMEKSAEETSQLKLQLDLQRQAAHKLTEELSAANVLVQELKSEAEASKDALAVLSSLAQTRLDKLVSAKSVLDAWQPNTSYLKSNKALRIELDGAKKAITEAREVL